MRNIIFVVFLAGCCSRTPDEVTYTRELLRDISNKQLNETNFPDGGKTGLFDAYGNEIRWGIIVGHQTGYTLVICSFGKDELPYTIDDMKHTRFIYESNPEEKALIDRHKKGFCMENYFPPEKRKIENCQ